MILMPSHLPDDSEQLKQMLRAAFEWLGRQQEIDQVQQSLIGGLKEQIKLLCYRLFGRRSEQSLDPVTPQLMLFNEPESVELMEPEAEEEVVTLDRCCGKRRPLLADLPRIGVIHELLGHELTCV